MRYRDQTRRTDWTRAWTLGVLVATLATPAVAEEVARSVDELRLPVTLSGGIWISPPGSTVLRGRLQRSTGTERMTTRVLTDLQQGSAPEATILDADSSNVSPKSRDSVVDGALIGLGAGVGVGILAFRGCSDDDSECEAIRNALVVTSGVAGAVVGAVVDWLRRPKRVSSGSAESRARPKTELDVVPIVRPDRRGVLVSLSF